MEIDERDPAVPPAGLDDARSYAARVTTPPVGAGPGEVFVTIPARGEFKHGPCRYQPVPGETPAVDDRCLVARADGVEDWWIVQFDSRDVMPVDLATQAELDAVEGRVDTLELAGAQFEMFLATTVPNHFTAGSPVKAPFDDFMDYGDGDVTCPGASLVNDNFTVQSGQEGTWLFSASVVTGTSVADGGLTVFSLFKNGSAFRRLGPIIRQGGAGTISGQGSVQARAEVGDVFDVRWTVPATISALGSASGFDTYFHGCRISA